MIHLVGKINCDDGFAEASAKLCELLDGFVKSFRYVILCFDESSHVPAAKRNEQRSRDKSSKLSFSKFAAERGRSYVEGKFHVVDPSTGRISLSPDNPTPEDVRRCLNCKELMLDRGFRRMLFEELLVDAVANVYGHLEAVRSNPRQTAPEVTLLLDRSDGVHSALSAVCDEEETPADALSRRLAEEIDLRRREVRGDERRIGEADLKLPDVTRTIEQIVQEQRRADPTTDDPLRPLAMITDVVWHTVDSDAIVAGVVHAASQWVAREDDAISRERASRRRLWLRARPGVVRRRSAGPCAAASACTSPSCSRARMAASASGAASIASRSSASCVRCRPCTTGRVVAGPTSQSACGLR